MTENQKWWRRKCHQQRCVILCMRLCGLVKNFLPVFISMPRRFSLKLFFSLFLLSSRVFTHDIHDYFYNRLNRCDVLWKLLFVAVSRRNSEECPINNFKSNCFINRQQTFMLIFKVFRDSINNSCKTTTIKLCRNSTE